MEDPKDCAICKKPIGALPKVTLGEKGCASINNASKVRKENVYCTLGQQVHQECRRKYCAPNQIAKALRKTDHTEKSMQSSSQQVLRSAEKEFDFSTHCFYCGDAVASGKKRKASDVVAVRTVETKDTILAVCKERGDYWANAVQARILCVHDLHAADAVYHRVCSANFRTMKQLPAAHGHEGMPPKRAKSGLLLEKQRAEAFLEVAKFLEENDDEQITIQDLVQHMEKILANSEHSAYSYQHMQQRLKEHFGNKIIETEINGKPNVITFRSKASEVLYDFHSQRDLDPEKEKL